MEEIFAEDRLDDSYFRDIFQKYNIVGDRSEFGKIITSTGQINIDFRDIITSLSGDGTNYIVTGFGQTMAEAFATAIGNILVATTSITRLLMQIFISPQRMTQIEEVRLLTEQVSNMSDSIELCFGIAHDDTLGNKIKVILLAKASA